MTDAKVERRHRTTAVELVKVPRVHPLCVEQWFDGAALPAWAEGVFAQAVSVAQALANAEQVGREKERERCLSACDAALDQMRGYLQRNEQPERALLNLRARIEVSTGLTNG
jgi:hypothetical protein